MGLYTIIYAAATDPAWVAPTKVIHELATLFQVDRFEAFSVSQETIPPGDPELLDEDRYDRLLELNNIAIEEGLKHHRAGSGFQTFMMFPYEGLMSDLATEIEQAIPTSISDGYVPWTAGIHNGRWSTMSYDEGTITNSGAFAVALSGHGCPAAWDEYLDRFAAVEGVCTWKSAIESIVGQPIHFIMELTQRDS